MLCRTTTVVFVLLLPFLPQDPPDETLPLTAKETELSVSSHLRFESDSSTQFVIYRGFVAAFNCRTKTSDFTIHQLTPEQISPKGGQPARRRSTFWTDESKLEGCSATNRDYARSGFDRGHMVPAGDFYWNQLLKNETFALTNISPQLPQLNRGIWNRLEEAIRRKVATISDTAYVITGTIFHGDSIIAIGEGRIGIPQFFYKVLYFPNSKLMYAFMFSNDASSYEGALRDFQVTVDAIERITKQDFFDRVEVQLQESVESTLFSFEEP